MKTDSDYNKYLLDNYEEIGGKIGISKDDYLPIIKDINFKNLKVLWKPHSDYFKTFESYLEFYIYGQGLTRECSNTGRTLSLENIKAGSREMEKALILSVVKNGAGAYIGDDPEIKKELSNFFDRSK